MPTQPIPKKILENKPELVVKTYNTLLVDGNTMLRVSMKDEQLSSDGRTVGGIKQFFIQLKDIMRRGKWNFQHVYVFFDGKSDGLYRQRIYSPYKANRDKEFSDEGELSDYMKAFNANLERMQKYIYKKQQKKSEKMLFYEQRDVIIHGLQELGVRVVSCDYVEADDLIAYYVKNKESNERIVIWTLDRDMTQLISDQVIVYVQPFKNFVNTKNHTQLMGYDYHNVLVKKILCGDTSDNIKGIKGVGETTLFNNFPEFKEREVTLEEVREKCRQLNEDRAKEKKKPLQWAKNIADGITDGEQGNEIYEINRKIIDLKNPIMDDEATETMESIMHAPMDCSDMSFSNLYNILKEAGVEDWNDENRFGNFFSEFNYLLEREKKFFQENS